MTTNRQRLLRPSAPALLFFGAALLLFLALISTTTIAAGPTSSDTPPTQLVSVSSAGVPANSVCKAPDISYDGRFIAFECRASNLVSGDTNKVSDIFVHDRQTGQTERVSVGPNGIQANGASSEPAISDDGRYVVFTSKATNLIPPPAQALGIAAYRGPGVNVYLHDRETHLTTLASRRPDGRPSDRRAWLPDISPDGRYIVYSSHSYNLVPPDRNGIKRDAFIYDRVLGTTEYADITSDGANPWSGGSIAAISADGRVVTYRSKAGDLVRGDTNRKFDIFAYERATRDIKRVSVSTTGQQGSADAHNPQVSADGKYIVYESPAPLDAPDQNSVTDIYVHHLPTAATTLVSLPSTGESTNGLSNVPVISGDGRIIAYVSRATNLVPDDTNGQADIFIFDQVSGQTTRVSLGDNDQQAGGASSTPAVSGDGKWVTFVSNAKNLISGITSRPGGIYVRRLDAAPPLYAISGTVLDVAGDPLPGVTIADGNGRATQTTDDGRYTLAGLPAGTYTLTAVKSGYAFEPQSRVVSVWPSAGNIDFTGTALLYAISGGILDDGGNPLAGVTISDGNGSETQTGDDGMYSLYLPAGTYTLTAALDGFAFDPPAREVTVPPDATGIDFTGALLTYVVSGTVLDESGQPLAGVTISDGNGSETQTGNDGMYSLYLPAGTYTLTAALDGYAFDPPAREVTVPPDTIDIDFTGTPVSPE